MKRFSMAMTWLALAGLMTTVSCRKPVVGFTNGEARTVTVSAVTESGGGSKTSIDGLYVKWSEGDAIRMNAESVLTLEDECAGSTMGRFTGKVTDNGPYYIGYPEGKTTYSGTTLKLNIPAEWPYNVEKQEVPMVAYAASVDDDVQFRNAVNMLKLQLKGDGTNASKLKSIVLTSATSYLSGDISVTFDEGGNPTFNAITDGTKTMTVSFGEEGLQLKADEVKCVYIPLAKIAAGEVLTVRFDCANERYMEKKVTATSDFDAVNNMLDCGVVEVIVPVFTVGMEGDTPITVEFAPGNLWYGIAAGESTPAFHFEANQWDYSVGDFYYTTEWGTKVYNWDPNHVSHFYWNDEVIAVTDVGDYTGGELFCASNFTVAGDSHTWRTLTCDEWNYLLGFDPAHLAQTETYGRPGAKAKSAWKDFGNNVKGLVILPDGTDASVMDNITSTSDLATYGAVFLPAAGERSHTEVGGVGSYGYYWSTTQYFYDGARAVIITWEGSVETGYHCRISGSSLRLVS